MSGLDWSLNFYFPLSIFFLISLPKQFERFLFFTVNTLTQEKEEKFHTCLIEAIKGGKEIV